MTTKKHSNALCIRIRETELVYELRGRGAQRLGCGLLKQQHHQIRSIVIIVSLHRRARVQLRVEEDKQ